MVFTPATKDALQEALNKWYEIANNSTDSDAVNTANSVTNAQYDAGTYPYYGNPNTWDVRGPEGGRITNMENLFIGKTGVNHPDISTWNVSHVTNIKQMFRATAFNGDISGWDVSSVENMERVFWDAAAFNQPIGNWDVSQVTKMTTMFYGATAFNQDIGQWNVSKVTNMTEMFYAASAFNKDINTKEVTAENSPTGVAYTAWDVSQVTSMSVMFVGARTFNKDISSWDVSSVEYMNYMFQDASNFNQNISYWNVNQYTSDGVTLTNLSEMFKDSGIDVNNTYGFSVPTPTYDQFNQDRPFKPADKTELQNAVNKWYDLANDGSENAVNTANSVTKAQYDADSSNVKYYGNPNTWDVSEITNMNSLFRDKTQNNHPDISTWHVSNVEDMGYMFKDATTFNTNIGQWNVSQVKYMNYMFQDAVAFNQDIGQWNVSQVTDMRYMFWYASAFNHNINTKEVTAENSPTGVAYTAWDVSQVTNMKGMFQNAFVFNQPIGKWDTSSVEYSNYMFFSAVAFDQNINTKEVTAENSPTGVAYTAWNVSQVTDMRMMFKNTDTFNKPIGNWDTSSVEIMSDMFENARAFDQNINTKEVIAENSPTGVAYTAWNVSQVRGMKQMFNGAIVFNQDISSWDVSSVLEIYEMFKGATAFNQNINIWKVDDIGLTDMFDSSGISNGTYGFTVPEPLYTQFNQNIGIKGVNTVSIEKGSTYTDAGAVAASDVTDFTTTSNVNTNIVGTYSVIYSGTKSGETVTATRTVNVVDTTSPVINTSSVVSSINDGQTALGSVSADEPVTWSITGTGVSISNSGVITLDTGSDYQTATSHSFTVTAKDPSDNTSTTGTLTVNVVDTTAPVITIKGDNPVTVEKGSTYTDDGASSDTDETVTSSGTVDTSVVGTYTITYSATDAAGNTGTATRTVNVLDTTDPVITSNLVSSVNDGETALGSVSADESVTWSVGGNKIISPSTVKIVSSSGNKYVFNGGNTYSGDAYLLTEGTTYTFENISPDHPMAILNNGKTSNISYSGDSDKKLTKSVTGTTNDGTYHFYYGTITVTVNGNFGNVSVYCYYHGYMGGQNILTYEDVQVNSAGEVSLKQSANYQIKQSYTYTIIATDDSNNTNSVTKTVNVVDTTAPVITTSSVLSTINDGETALGSVSANEPVSWSITGTGVSISSSGDITLDSAADYQTATSHSFTVTATDPSNNSTTTATLTVNVVDTTDPVITVTGDNPVTVEKGSTYSDDGATASDNVDGDLTSDIVITGTVDTSVVGTYTLTYSVTDEAGNTGTATRIVNVVDTTPPVITVTGDNPLTVEKGSTYTDAGATADGGETVTSSGTVNTTVVGSYTLTYSATDAAGNTGTATRIVNVVDTTPPVITVTGDNPVTVEKGSTYTDAGATASDNVDGDLTSDIVITGTVDTSVVGTYTLTYSVTDEAGNTGTATRTVNVVDTAPPVITVTGDNPVTVEKGSTYTDAGATASDNVDGDLTSDIVITGTVDTSVAGTYTLTYSVTDAAGNTGTATRTVNVVDITPPVITVTGDNPATVEKGSTYSDDGATASDNVDGDLTSDIVITGTVDTSVVGTYTLTYSVTDEAGNTGSATRTVNVVDTTAPIITKNLRSKINNGQTSLGSVSANEPVTWSTNNPDIQIDGQGNVSLQQPANYKEKTSYSFTITATDPSNNTKTTNGNVSVYQVFTPETKDELITALNKWYEIANNN